MLQRNLNFRQTQQMFAHTFRFAERNFRCVEGKHDLIQVPVTLRLQEETAQIQLKLSPSN